MSDAGHLAVSVVVPTYRRPQSVLRLLRALAAQETGAPRFEAIIALDGADAIASASIAAMAWPFPVQVLTLEHGGRARAANAGIRASRGDVVILLDDDMEPTLDFVAAHAAAHRSDDRLGVVGAAPIRTAGAPSVVTYVGRKFNRHLRMLAQPGHAMTYREFYSGNFSARRTVLDDIGLFDEQFRVYGNEDGELALRLLAGGVRLVYGPIAAAQQHYLKDFAGLVADTQAKGVTAVQLARKHPLHASALKLSRYGHGSRKWLALRRLLLRASSAQLPVSRLILAWVAWHERLRLPRLVLAYELALDYFYWAGVRSALAPGETLTAILGAASAEA